MQGRLNLNLRVCDESTVYSPQGIGHDDSLNLVVRRGDTLKHFEAVQRCCATGSLVRDHAAAKEREREG